MWQSIKNIYHLALALLANIYYGFPANKLTVIGVTGTDGKTTTTNMIYHVLKEAGYKVSMISTVKAVIAGKEYDTGFHVTTPDPHVLPKFLREAVSAGDKYFVLEISSHALDQNRAEFVRFNIGVLTNLSHEHLDYHKTFANYAKAKFKLLRAATDAIVIADKGIDFNTTIKAVIRFGLESGNESQKKWELKLKIPGDFNTLNALASASVARFLGVSEKKIKDALENFSGIPGRFEEIKTGKDFRVIIDFAHKPNALAQVLETARSQLTKGGRVIAMYGCASERDVLKRSMMGEISGRLADITVLTDEDPRFEDSIKIINEIATGCLKAKAKEFQISNFKFPISNELIFYKIPNRKKAIEFIIRKLAKKGDIVLLCGKGHEKSMNYRGVEEPWSEHEAVRKALKG